MSECSSGAEYSLVCASILLYFEVLRMRKIKSIIPKSDNFAFHLPFLGASSKTVQLFTLPWTIADSVSVDSLVRRRHLEELEACYDLQELSWSSQAN